MTGPLALRGLAAVALFLVVALYYAHGLSFQIWPDSDGYLAQALGLLGQTPYARPGDRTVGYPLLVAAALATPRPALVLVVAQAALAVAGFAAVCRALTRLAVPRFDLSEAERRLAGPIIVAALSSAGLYSVVHVQIAALLTEILFAVLVLAALLAVVWLVLPGRVARWPWIETAVAAGLATLPLLVKPHWLFAAPVLVLVAALWLGLCAGPPGLCAAKRGLRTAAALALAIATAALVTLPDRMLTERFSAREHAIFGAKTAFCNHAHMIMAALNRHPEVTLGHDPLFENAIRSHLAELVSTHTGGWRLLGFNGDRCFYNEKFTALLDARFPAGESQRRFLLGSLARAWAADPLPFLANVVAQIAAGFHTAFGRFAVHARPGLETYRAVTARWHLPDEFASGVTVTAELGPLDTKARLDGTMVGRLTQALLAILFFSATAVLIALALASAILPWRLWRHWPGPVRRNFVALVALPLGVLLAHHALIALVHTFDVWRYGFNMIFVNLFFMGTAALFWWSDWQRRRAGRSGSVTAI